MTTDDGGEATVDAVLAAFADTPNPRLREIVTGLVTHLHSFLREIRPTQAEWERAIGFLTATGQACSDTRQEFVLLSDVLGVSSLVETINASDAPDATEATVLGPFHLTESPPRELGDSIDLIGTGQPCVVAGSVRSSDGNPLPGARVDVWQANEHGYYDVQQPDEQPAGNLRGLFTTDAAGRFRFRTVVPAHYPVPTDGPVGTLLTSTGRHAYRPAHIHFIAEAGGHLPVTTHLFRADSDYIDSDAVFAVKRSLIREFTESDDADLAARHGVTAPFRHATFDIVLQRR